MKNKRAPANSSRLFHVFLVLSFSLNIILLLGPGGERSTSGRQPVTLQALGEIKEAGIFGPSDIEIVEGSLTISSGGVRLQNTLITSDLLLTEGIGDGGVDLLNVTVKETALIQGGGVATIVFENATLNHLVIDRQDGKVRVVLKGNTRVESVTIKGETILSTAGLSEEGYVKDIHIETAAETELEGVFKAVTVSALEARVAIIAGRVELFSSGREARDVLLTLHEGVEIDRLEPGAPLQLAGEGTAKEVKIAVPGLFKLGGSVERVTAGGRGIFLEFAAGSTAMLVVEASEGTVMIHLAREALIGQVELNGAAGITGEGTIERIRVNAAGTTIDLTPGHLVLAPGVKAEVGGKVMTGETARPEPQHPAPTPDPAQPTQPTQPTVSLDALTNMTLAPGQSGTRNIAVSPGDARIVVSSSNNNVATVSLSGNTITVQGVNNGSATISVTASKQGFNSRTRTFTATIDPVKTFTVLDGLSLPGKRVVLVELRYSDPQNYRVTINNIELKYMPDEKAFREIVPESDAQRINVRVSRR